MHTFLQTKSAILRFPFCP